MTPEIDGTEEFLIPPTQVAAENMSAQIAKVVDSPRKRALRKFGLAAIGAIPWVGGFLTAFIELRSKGDGEKIDEIQREWIELHAEKMDRLQGTLRNIADRLESFGDEINARIESPEFLALVDKGFRAWDSAATQEKRDFVRRLLTNAAASSLCPDDLVRLFLDWIERYDDTHFRVMRAIYHNPGINRRDIWLTMHGAIPREDSSEADLFKLLIADLSIGHVIRQRRQTTDGGQFYKKPTSAGRASKSRPASPIMKSAFDTVEPYELTDLGRQFIHYVMEELAPQIGSGGRSAK